MTWVLILVFLALLIPDLPGLVKRRQWAELTAFFLLWAAGFALSLLVHYGVPFHQVNTLLRAVFEPIGQFFIQPPPD